MEKNSLIAIRNTIEGKDKKERDRRQFYLDPEAVEVMIKELESTRGNERGAKLTVHTGLKTSDEGRSFLSSFAFVQPVQSQGTTAPTRGTYVEKKGMSEETRATAARTLNATVE